MKNKEYQECLMFCVEHVTKYNNTFPYNCLYRHTDSKWTADCNNTVKSIINSQGAFRTEAKGAYVNPNGMTGDCDEWNLYAQCTPTTFDKMNDGRVKCLYMQGHIGSGYGKEFTMNGNVYNTIETTGSEGDFGRDGCIATYTTASGQRLNHKGGYSMGQWARVGYFPTSWVEASVEDNYTSTHTVVANYIKGMTAKEVETAMKPIFNATYYKKKYPNIKKAIGTNSHDLLQYFLNGGMSGNTQGAATFDCTYYEQNNADLQKEFKTNYPAYYIHYLQFGKKEGRRAYLCKDVPADYKYYKQIKYCIDKGLFKLKSTFGIGNTISRLGIALIMYRLAGKPAVSTATLPYSDIKDLTTIQKKALAFCREKNIIKGYKDGTFRPNKPVSKRATAIYLYRYAGKPAVSGKIGYTDVADKEGSEGYKAIAWVISKGLMKGKQGKWMPKNAMKKYYLCIILYRYLGGK